MDGAVDLPHPTFSDETFDPVFADHRADVEHLLRTRAGRRIAAAERGLRGVHVGRFGAIGAPSIERQRTAVIRIGTRFDRSNCVVDPPWLGRIVALGYPSDVRETAPGDPPAHPGTGDFLVVAGHGKLTTHVIATAAIVIGRDPDCDLVIDHPTLSRRHAILRLGPPLTIQDLGSKNGVRVSRKTMHGGAPVELEPGETFRIGGFSFNLVGRDLADASSGNAPERLRVVDPTVEGVPPFIRDVATSGTSVLVLGESGAGKDVLAETLHALSERTGELARVNCAALAEPLIESELFGHEKGAFTGATASKAGLLESAQGGTVFLDEIGEMPLSIQAKLLRAIESREILRIGSVRPIKIDVRFIAATNRDLPAEVAAKRFRHDLFFRLDGITLVVPPLRERRDRIPALAIRFLEASSKKLGRSSLKIAPDVFDALVDYDWPGNVRELKAVAERSVLLARGGEIRVEHLAFSPRAVAGDALATAPTPSIAVAVAGTSADDDDPALAQLTAAQRAQRRELIDALEKCSGNQTRAAKILGISRTTMVNRLKLFRIARPRG
jgi:DNA-binding NtrC family response regulator